MQQNEELYYLIAGFIYDWCDIELFCDEFYKMYDLESQYCATNKAEEQALKELDMMTGRFSEFDEDFKKAPNVFFKEGEIRQKAEEIFRLFSNIKISKEEFFRFLKEQRGLNFPIGVDLGEGYVMCPNCSNAMKVDERQSVITCDNKYCIAKFINPLAKLTLAKIESAKYNSQEAD